jgi:hypothetical protein
MTAASRRLPAAASADRANCRNLICPMPALSALLTAGAEQPPEAFT